MPSADKLLRLALVVFGVVALLLYPLALVWPSGWAWHSGAPYESEYFMMIVGLYATLGVFLINAARNPAANLSNSLLLRRVLHAERVGRRADLRPRVHIRRLPLRNLLSHQTLGL